VPGIHFIPKANWGYFFGGISSAAANGQSAWVQYRGAPRNECRNQAGHNGHEMFAH